MQLLRPPAGQTWGILVVFRRGLKIPCGLSKSKAGLAARAIQTPQNPPYHLGWCQGGQTDRKQEDGQISRTSWPVAH